MTDNILTALIVAGVMLSYLAGAILAAIIGRVLLEIVRGR